MFIFKTIISASFIAIAILANPIKLRELIVRVHAESDSASVYYIGNDEEFLSDFVKNEALIPISIFNLNSNTKNRRQCTNIIVVFEVPITKNPVSSILLRNIIESLQVRKFVIISAENLEGLKQYFSFFSKRKFTRIFGITKSRMVSLFYAYLPFAENPIQQLVENISSLPDALRNFNGFALRTNVHNDVPRTFWYPDKTGRRCMGGPVGQLFLQFLRKHNATFKEITFNNSGEFFLNTIIKTTANGELDVSMNAYYPQKNLDISYPVSMVENIMMVPLNGYLDPVEYFQRPFDLKSWICIGFTALYIILSKITLNRLTNLQLDIWESFIQVYLTLLSSSTANPIHSHHRFYLVVMLFGFIFERLYGSHFQSFLTAYIKIKQYDTIDDLMKNNVPLLISTFEWDLRKNISNPKNFDKIVVPIDTIEFTSQLLTMRNTSSAFVLENDRCQLLIGINSLNKNSLFRRARQVLNSYYIGFMLAFHSPFKEILNEFIIEIKETVLIQKWESEVLRQAKAHGFLNDTNLQELVSLEAVHNPLTLHHLEFAWECLVFGLTLSSVTFVFELVLNVVNKNKLS